MINMKVYIFHLNCKAIIIFDKIISYLYYDHIVLIIPVLVINLCSVLKIFYLNNEISDFIHFQVNENLQICLTF